MKVVVFRQKLLYSDKVVVFGEKVDVFGKVWLYSGITGCIR